MTVNYTTLLGLAKPVSGTEIGTWGDAVNNNLTDYLDSAVAGAQIISGSLTAVTLSKTTGASLSQAGTGATGSSQYQIIRCTGNPASLLTITAPAADKTYVVINATSTSQSVKIVGAGPTTGVTILSGKTSIVAWNGSDFVEVSPNTISGTLPVANGGTGVTTSTGSGSVVLNTSPSLITPVLGTPTSGNFSSGTFTWPTFNQDTTGYASALKSASTTVSVSASTAPSTGQVLTATSSTTATWQTPSTSGGTVTSVAALTLGTSGTDVSSTVANSTTTPVITLNLPTASATNRGVLSAADWTTFNAKGSGTVTSVSGTAPVVSSGGSTPAISMAAATSSVNGYLTSTDWTTFNDKLSTTGGTMTGLLTTKELALTKTAPSISAGVLTLDCSLANTFAVSLNAAITSFTVSNIPTTGSYYEFNLEFTADGTARSVTWTFSSVAVKWPGGTAPTLTSTSGKKDTFVFYTYDAGTTWLGFVAGQNL